MGQHLTTSSVYPVAELLTCGTSTRGVGQSVHAAYIDWRVHWLSLEESTDWVLFLPLLTWRQMVMSERAGHVSVCAVPYLTTVGWLVLQVGFLNEEAARSILFSTHDSSF